MKRRFPSILRGFYLLFFAVAVLGATPGFAQQKAETTLKDIPDEYLEEANDFYMYCESNNLMTDYYDCECLAATFLDQRIKVGPEIPRDTIMFNIQKSCFDAAGAAGSNYNQCLSQAVLLPLDKPVEEYCTCVANTYAKLYETYKVEPSTQTMIEAKTRAYITCEDPALARRLYPYPAPSDKR